MSPRPLVNDSAAKCVFTPEASTKPRAGAGQWSARSEGVRAQHEFRVVRTTKDRALYSYEVGGRTRSAVVFVQEPWNSDRGWWRVESTASCDPAEFLPSDDEVRGLEIWSDRDGDRVDSRRIVGSGSGPVDVCEWGKARLLELGEGPSAGSYLRDTVGALERRSRKPNPYLAHTKLPKAAVDSGFRRNGTALWLTDDAVYLVSANNVERWPRVPIETGCI